MLVVCALETFLKLIPSSPTMLIQNFEIQFILNLNQPPTPSSLESIEPQKICNNQIVVENLRTVAQLWWTLRKAICWDCTSVYFNLQRSLSLKRSTGKITFHLWTGRATKTDEFSEKFQTALDENSFLLVAWPVQIWHLKRIQKQNETKSDIYFLSLRYAIVVKAYFKVLFLIIICILVLNTYFLVPLIGLASFWD